jgi:hypothetical protein
MAKTAILAVKVIGDATGGARALDQTGSSAGRMGSRLSKASKVASIGLAGLAVASVRAAKAAAQDQKSQALLANTMQRNAGASSAQIAATEKWIDAQARASGVADDQLRPALGTLLRATGDVATSQSALKVAMDVSAATGKPLEAVSAALAKGYGGQTTAIGRLVPGMSDAAKKSGDMAVIMDELAKKTGGSVAAAAATTEGKFAKLKVTFGELEESLGAVLLPIMDRLAAVMALVAAFATQHQTTFTIIVAVIAALAAAVIVTNAAYSAYIAITRIATVAAKAWAVAQRILNVALRANPIGLIVTAIALLVAGVILAYKKSATFRTIVQALGKAGQVAIGWIVTKVTELWKWLGPKLGPAFTTVKDTAVKAFNAMMAPIRTVIDLVKSVIEWIKKIKFPSVPKAISNLGKGGPPPAGYAGSRVAYSGLPGRGGPGDGVFTSRISRAGGGAQIIQITVNGALDPNAVARQIEKLLVARGRRLGVVTS